MTNVTNHTEAGLNFQPITRFDQTRSKALTDQAVVECSENQLPCHEIQKLHLIISLTYSRSDSIQRNTGNIWRYEQLAKSCKRDAVHYKKISAINAHIKTRNRVKLSVWNNHPTPSDPHGIVDPLTQFRLWRNIRRAVFHWLLFRHVTFVESTPTLLPHVWLLLTYWPWPWLCQSIAVVTG